MRISKKNVLNILLFALVLSFFIPPVGYQAKILLNRLFSFSPDVIEAPKREQIMDYNWKLKDANWDYFNFDRSKGKVIFINFWASWRLPCAAELQSIQKLHDTYSNKVDFYLITDEERPPVEEFMEENDFTFPVTFLIIGERTPIETKEPPLSYIIDKNGYVVVKKEGIADWDNAKINALLDKLIEE